MCNGCAKQESLELLDELGAEVVGTKQVTLREVIAAARQNGLPHIRGMFFRRGEYNKETNTYAIGGGCALAQAGYNLGINPMELANKRIKAPDGKGYRRPFEAIVVLNDNENKKRSLSEIADHMETKYQDILDVPVEVTEVDYSKGFVPGL